MSSPPMPPHPEGTFNEHRSCQRLHDLDCMHCIYYPEFLLGNNVSNTNDAVIMLLLWSIMTIILTFR